MATIIELVEKQTEMDKTVKQTVYLECYNITMQNFAFESADEIRIILETNYGMEFDAQGKVIDKPIGA